LPASIFLLPHFGLGNKAMYDIEFADEVSNHLEYLTARQRSLVLDAVEEQLTYQATVETRNRKLMRPNSLAQWELRVSDFRIFYIVDD
jgi:mRNA-degrading endonuclease RelE of RelBE toxin-antitoxin system